MGDGGADEADGVWESHSGSPRRRSSGGGGEEQGGALHGCGSGVGPGAGGCGVAAGGWNVGEAGEGEDLRGMSRECFDVGGPAVELRPSRWV